MGLSHKQDPSEPKRQRRKALLSEIEQILYRSDEESIVLIPPFQEDKLLWWEKLAYAVASSVGSWKFIMLMGTILVFWCTFNLFEGYMFDPFPYIFLNLLLGTAAAFQAPIILMAANAQYKRDSQRDNYHYEVQVATEAELRAAYDRLNSIELTLAVQSEETNYIQDNMQRSLDSIVDKSQQIVDGTTEYKVRVDKISEDVKLMQQALEVISTEHVKLIRDMFEDLRKLKENENGRERRTGTTGTGIGSCP